MEREHIVKSYGEELEQLNNTIIEMGGLAEAQIEAAVQALVTRDPELANTVIKDDDKVDELNYEVDTLAMRLLALRQPMALDLRNVVAALKISSDLERIADYASNMARRSIALSETEPVKPVYVIPRAMQSRCCCPPDNPVPGASIRSTTSSNSPARPRLVRTISSSWLRFRARPWMRGP